MEKEKTKKIMIEADQLIDEVKEEEIKDLAPVKDTSSYTSRKRYGEEAPVPWTPKTKLGKIVKNKEITDIDYILDNDLKLLEPEIVDELIPLKSDLILIGQSKGKFGGGKRRAWKQTQRKTKEGNRPTFSSLVAVGDENGHVGIGHGRAKETLPARDKALRKAKLDIIKLGRGCGSFDCACDEKHTIPFKVDGRCGSSRVFLWPAPQGAGLVIGDEGKKILALAGIKDIYSKSFGQTRTTLNFARAIIEALKKTNLKLRE